MTPSSSRGVTLARAALTGALAGLAGAGVMEAGEKLEQAITKRPSSFVPGRTLLTLLGRRPSDADTPVWANQAMHFATGALLGALRGLWAATGMRGPRAAALHTAARLSTDQSLENATGVGAPPHTWPALEQSVDFLHKAVYSFVTGAIADRFVDPTLQSARGRTSH